MGKNNKGQSLVAALVGAAITGIVMMGVIQMFKSQSVGLRAVTQQTDASDLLNEFRGTFRFADLCATNFAGIDVSATTNSPLPNTLKVLSSIRPAAGATPVLSVGDTYGINSIQLTGMVLHNPRLISASGGTMQLQVATHKLGTSIGGSDKRTDLTLFFTVNSGSTVITGCATGLPSALNISSGTVNASPAPHASAASSLTAPITLAANSLVTFVGSASGTATGATAPWGVLWQTTYSGGTYGTFNCFELSIRTSYGLIGNAATGCTGSTSNQWLNISQSSVSAACTVALAPGAYNLSAGLNNGCQGASFFNRVDVSTFQLNYSIVNLTN